MKRYVVLLILATSSFVFGQKNGCAAYGDGSDRRYSKAYFLIEGLGPKFVSSMGVRWEEPVAGAVAVLLDVRVAWNTAVSNESQVGWQLGQGVLLGSPYRNIKYSVGMTEMWTYNRGQYLGNHNGLSLESQPNYSEFSFTIDIGVNFLLFSDLLVLAPEFNLTFFTSNLNHDAGFKSRQSGIDLIPAAGLEISYWL